MTSASIVWTHSRWAPYCRVREAATPSPSGTVPEMATESDAGGVFAGSAPRRVGRGEGPGLRDPVVPAGAEPPRVEVGGVPPDVGVAGDQLVHAQRPGVAGADPRVVVQPDFRSGDRACRGPECRHMFLEPRRASALVHHQVSRVLRLVLQRVHCHVWVVRHPRSYQQGGATGGSTGPGLACPHLHYYPLGLELRLPRRSGALVVRGVDESQAGVPCAGGVEEVDQGVAPPGVLDGLLLAAAIVEVFIGALVEAFSHRRRPQVVVVGEGVAWPLVPMPRRRVWHRQAARVAVSQLDGAPRDDVARQGL